MVYGLLRALPGDRAFLSPSSAKACFANLTPASRRQNHTTSPSASSALVSSTVGVHRIPPRVRDDRDTPLEWDETKRVVKVICLFGKSESFFKKGWTGKSADDPTGKSVGVSVSSNLDSAAPNIGDTLTERTLRLHHRPTPEILTAMFSALFPIPIPDNAQKNHHVRSVPRSDEASAGSLASESHRPGSCRDRPLDPMNFTHSVAIGDPSVMRDQVRVGVNIEANTRRPARHRIQAGVGN
jgi:hypothetical protein